MKKKSRKFLLHRESLYRMGAEEAGGAAVQAFVEDPFSADLCKSCLCVSEPESVCLCSDGNAVVAR